MCLCIISLVPHGRGKTRFHVFPSCASSRCKAMRLDVCGITLEAGIPVSEVIEPGVAENLERQNRFIADNLRRIFVQIYRIVGNVDDAQDLAQETFIKALQRQDQLKDELKAGHWLSRIATNTALDLDRKSTRLNS